MIAVNVAPLVVLLFVAAATIGDPTLEPVASRDSSGSIVRIAGAVVAEPAKENGNTYSGEIPARRNSGGRNLFGRTPLTLPSEEKSSAESANSSSTGESTAQSFTEHFRYWFPFAAAAIILLLGIM